MKIILLIILISVFIIGCTSSSYGDYKLTEIDDFGSSACCHKILNGKLVYRVHDGGLSYISYDGKVHPQGYSRIPMSTVSLLNDGSIFFVAETKDRETIYVSDNEEVLEKYPNLETVRVIDGNIVAQIMEDGELITLVNWKKTEKQYSELVKELMEGNEKIDYKETLEDMDCKVVDVYGTDIVNYEKPGFYLECNGEKISKNYAFISEKSVTKFDGKYAFMVNIELNEYLFVYDGMEIKGKICNTGEISLYQNSLVFDGCKHIYSLTKK